MRTMPVSGGPRHGAGGQGASAPVPGTKPKVLIAGVERDQRDAIEAAVRRALPARATGQWSVSLVRIGTQWSVSLTEPGLEPKSFGTDAAGLEQAIRAAIGDPIVTPEPPAAGSPADPGPSGSLRIETRIEHVCRSCRRPFAVLYDARRQEPKVSAPVACPHCWQIDRVEIGDWAASGHDYRTVKL